MIVQVIGFAGLSVNEGILPVFSKATKVPVESKDKRGGAEVMNDAG